MRISKFLFGLIAVLVISSSGGTVYLYAKFLQRNEEIATLKRSLERQTNLLSDYQVIQLYDWIAGLGSVKDIRVSSLEGEEHQLFDLINNTKGILYIENGMCEACIQKELLNIGQVAKVLGKENIILLTKGYTSRYLMNSDEFANWNDQVFQAEASPTLLNDNLSGTPCLLIVDRTYRIRGAYHALKSTNKNFEFFLSALQQTYSSL